MNYIFKISELIVLHVVYFLIGTNAPALYALIPCGLMLLFVPGIVLIIFCLCKVKWLRVERKEKEVIIIQLENCSS